MPDETPTQKPRFQAEIYKTVQGEDEIYRLLVVREEIGVLPKTEDSTSYHLASGFISGKDIKAWVKEQVELLEAQGKSFGFTESLSYLVSRVVGEAVEETPTETSELVRLINDRERDGEKIVIPEGKRVAEVFRTKYLSLKRGHRKKELVSEADRQRPIGANAYLEGLQTTKKNSVGDWVGVHVSVQYFRLEDDPNYVERLRGLDRSLSESRTKFENSYDRIERKSKTEKVMVEDPNRLGITGIIGGIELSQGTLRRRFPKIDFEGE